MNIFLTDNLTSEYVQKITVCVSDAIKKKSTMTAGDEVGRRRRERCALRHFLSVKLRRYGGCATGLSGGAIHGSLSAPSTPTTAKLPLIQVCFLPSLDDQFSPCRH